MQPIPLTMALLPWALFLLDPNQPTLRTRIISPPTNIRRYRPILHRLLTLSAIRVLPRIQRKVEAVAFPKGVVCKLRSMEPGRGRS